MWRALNCRYCVSCSNLRFKLAQVTKFSNMVEFGWFWTHFLVRKTSILTFATIKSENATIDEYIFLLSTQTLLGLFKKNWFWNTLTNFFLKFPFNMRPLRIKPSYAPQMSHLKIQISVSLLPHKPSNPPPVLNSIRTENAESVERDGKCIPQVIKYSN